MLTLLLPATVRGSSRGYGPGKLPPPVLAIHEDELADRKSLRVKPVPFSTV
jgi:hypothetical protein